MENLGWFITKSVKTFLYMCVCVRIFRSFCNFEYSIPTCCVPTNWKIQFKSFFATSQWSVSSHIIIQLHCFAAQLILTCANHAKKKNRHRKDDVIYRYIIFYKMIDIWNAKIKTRKQYFPCNKDQNVCFYSL